MATLTIDASGTEGVNLTTYFSDYFAQFSAAAMRYYDGEATSAFGGSYYVSGDQVLAQMTDAASGTTSAAGVLIEGEDIAYDFMVYGSSYGHGISGEIDSLTFGNWTEATSGTQGTGDAGAITGYAAEVTISGFDLSAEPGAGSDPATNPVQAIYSAIKGLSADALTDIIDGYALDITGSAGADTLDGYGAADTLAGGAGDDLLLNSRGADSLSGGEGNDTLSGGEGRDVLAGDAGDDVLAGNGQADTITGGAGDDTITGGHGADLLTGGDGQDVFVFTANTLRDTVTDFTLGEDLLDVSALGLSSVADITVVDTARGVNLVIDDVLIRLYGVEVAEVTESLFQF